MSLLRDAWTIARKDLRIYFRDRTGMLLGFLLPVALVTAFGFLAQTLYGSGAMGRTTLWFADEDHSASSEAFVDQLRQASTIALRPRVDEEPLGADEARLKVTGGDAHHALVIPAGFGAALEAGELPPLRMARDPDRSMEDQMVSVGLMQAYIGATQGRSWPAMMGRQMQKLGMPGEQVQGVVGATEFARSLIENFVIEQEETKAASDAADGDSGPDEAFDMAGFFSEMVPVTYEDIPPPARPRQMGYMQAQTVSGMIVMMLMFSLVACGATLIQEREQGTFPRLLVAPVARDAILLGKLLFAAIVGLLQLTVLFTYGELLFGFGAFQDPVTLAVLMVSLTAAVSGFGILVAVWARTLKQAEGVSTLIILLMSCLGGAWFPLQMFDVPHVVEIIMRCTLVHWAMTGFQGLFFYQRTWTHPDMLASIGVLWGVAAVTLGFSRWLFFRRLALSKS